MIKLKTVDKTKAVFLDRDGVINVDKGYVYKAEDLVFTPHIFEALKGLQQKGYALFVVTNQSGVARGYYTEQDVVDFHKEMDLQLKAKDITITSWYYCPHHLKGQDKAYQLECHCRKPKTGMIDAALKEHPAIDINNSFMVGDKISDIDCGLAAGLKTIQIDTGRYPLHHNPGATCKSLYEALELF